MVQIVNASNGEILGQTDKVRYIRRSPAGNYVEATRDTAQGVAYRGTAYNLFGMDGVEAEETVILNEIDIGELADRNRADIDYILALEGLL